MTSFLQGLLLIVLVLCFCAGISLCLSPIISWFKNRASLNQTHQTKSTEGQPTIYLIEHTKKPKRRKARRKSTDVALKGLMITPEKFEAIKNSNFEDF